MNGQPDPFHLIQIANPVPDPDRMPDGPQSASAQALIEEIIGMTTTETTKQPTHRRRTATLAVAGLAVVGVAAVWALARPETSTRIQCPGNSIIAAVSGDPVLDCANEMRQQGHEPPTLAAYLNEHGGVVVVEAGSEVPSAWQPLAGDFRQDTAIIELEAALDDVGTGLRSRCHTSVEAVPVVERELARLGLQWTVNIRDDADGNTTCAFSFLEPEDQQVTIVAIEGLVGTGDEPWAVLGTRLNQVLGEECLTLDVAAIKAADLAVEARLDPDSQQVQISTTVDNGASCTRATVNVGGAVLVDLRGPTGD